jgi:uncharacterized membrane protein YheB (UPF0754 family)
MFYEFILLPTVGALIGWFTNLLAIKLIFRPLKPFRIPLINWDFQGLIPKRRAQIAGSIGQIVEKELISVEDIIGHSNTPEVKKEVLLTIKKTIIDKVSDRIPGFIPLGLQAVLLKYIEDILDKEAESLFKSFMERFSEYMIKDVKVGKTVEDRINALDVLELERLVMSVSQRELKHIEILGGIIGFLIGLGQAGLLFFLNAIS